MAFYGAVNKFSLQDTLLSDFSIWNPALGIDIYIHPNGDQSSFLPILSFQVGTMIVSEESVFFARGRCLSMGAGIAFSKHSSVIAKVLSATPVEDGRKMDYTGFHIQLAIFK